MSGTPLADSNAKQSKPSKIEDTKYNSRFLRGTLKKELDSDSSQFNGGDLALLKFHGTYQQDDRDERKARPREQRTYSLMIRSRIPGGTLTAEQYRVYDDLADRYAGGQLRFTTRQTIQLHGVLKSNARAAMQGISRALLTTAGACGDLVRNVMVTPDPRDTPQLRALRDDAHQLSERFKPATNAYAEVWLDGDLAATVSGEEQEPFYGQSYLPRKFKMGFTHSGDNSIDAYTQDAAFVALPGPAGLIEGYNVLAGGGLGMTHRNPKTFPRLADEIGFIERGALASTAEAIVAVHRDYGDRSDRKHARLKYVIDDRGVDWFRQEVERRAGRPFDPFRPMRMEAADWYGWTDLGGGAWCLGLPVPSGRVSDSTPGRGLKSFLRGLAGNSSLTFRLTPQQHVLVIGIPGSEIETINRLGTQHGLGLDAPPTLTRDALACPAMPTCGLALTEAERWLPTLAFELETALRNAYPGAPLPPTLRVTGCPNGCARPYTAEIGVVGRGPMQFNLYLGGSRDGTRLGRLFRESVPSEEIAPLLRTAFGLWAATARGDAFGDFADTHWDLLANALGGQPAAPLGSLANRVEEASVSSEG